MARTKKTEEEIVKAPKNKTLKTEYVSAVGRRKEAIARVRLYPNTKTDVMWGEQVIKKGEIFVNEKPINTYFSSMSAKMMYDEPFDITNTKGKFTATIRVSGGGNNGQLDAAILGIARALIVHDKSFRPALKKKGLLSRDSRIRERRKVGTGGKARRKKQSPKR